MSDVPAPAPAPVPNPVPAAAAPASAAAPAPAAPPARIKIDQFKAVDLRAAKVLDVREHPNADRLWIIDIDVGELGKRQVVAGLRKDATKEELIGRTVIVLANLEPAMLRGVESQGMLLALRGTERAFPLGVTIDVAPGTRVT